MPLAATTRNRHAAEQTSRRALGHVRLALLPACDDVSCVHRLSLSPTVQENTNLKEKSAAVFAVRRANYTHRRKGVFNVQSIEHLPVGGNVRYRTTSTRRRQKLTDMFLLNPLHCVKIPAPPSRLQWTIRTLRAAVPSVSSPIGSCCSNGKAMPDRDTITIGAPAGGVRALLQVVCPVSSDLAGCRFMVLQIPIDVPNLLATLACDQRMI